MRQVSEIVKVQALAAARRVAGLCLLGLLAAPAWATGAPNFVMPDPASPLYRSFAAVAGGHLQVEKDCSLTGNVHGNANVDLDTGDLVTGNVSAVGRVKNQGTVTGSVTSGAAARALPDLPTEAQARALANRVFEKDTTFKDAEIDDIVFVAGDVHIRGSLNGNGTIIARHDLQLDDADPKQPISLAPTSRLSLVAFQDLQVGQGRPLRGLLLAGQDAHLGANVRFAGVLVARRELHVGKSSQLAFLELDTTPPAISNLTPADGSLLASGTPAISASFSDDLSGVDSASVRFLLDGTDQTGAAQVSAAGFSFTPATPLADGSHTAALSVRDLARNLAQASWSFTTDTTPPVLLITSPSMATVLGNASPPLAVSYTDATSGVDLASLHIVLDGTDLTASCQVAAAAASCTPPPLQAGAHSLGASVRDRAGNQANASLAFQLVLDTTPPILSNVTPGDGSVLATATPVVSAAFSDPDSGIDPTTVRVIVDGVDQTAAALVSNVNTFFTPASPLAEGRHSATISVSDSAGNQAQSTVHFTVDTVPPTLAITSPGPQVTDDLTPAIGVSYSDATSGVSPATFTLVLDATDITSSCTTAASAATCTAPTLAAGQHTLVAQVRDVAGNLGVATSTFNLTLDTTPPTLAITAPSTPLVVGGSPLAVQLQYSDAGSGVDTMTLQVLLDGANLTAGCSIGAAAAQCPGPLLARGAHALSASLADRRGNLATVTLNFQVVFPLQVAFTSPPPDTVTAVAVVQVAGTVAPQAVSVAVNGVAASVANGAFTIPSLGLHDGVNNLVAVAQDAAGNVGTATLRVTVDVTPPQVSITSPGDGSVTAATSITVAGLVNDLTIGTVSDTEVSVTVNGVGATVANRSFVAQGVPLAAGTNAIVATAVDRAGNHSAAQIQVTQRSGAGAPSIQAAGGDLQTAQVLAPLPQPLAVQVNDAAGQPLPGRLVLFQVAQGNGQLAGGGRSQVVTSDAQGRAAVTFVLGNRAGAAVNRVRATAVGIAGEVLFAAVSTAGAAATVDVASGDNQRGGIGTDLPLPLVAFVTDGHQNPLAGVAVTFQSVLGGGSFAGAPNVVATTDSSGLARARLTLGPAAGFDNHRVEASFPGLTALPATFKASAFVLGDPAATVISGVILDNQGAPVPGVTMRLRGSLLAAQTDAQGQFRLGAVPVGQAFLIADATTTTRAGSWASLEYEIFALPGVENTLPRPIYILPLDLAHGVMVDETHGGTVTIPGVPGFALDVAPGSVTFPGGGRSGVVSVTAVHADKIPMPPGAGMQPRLIVTIQPAGARFNPPAPLTLPNVEALPPGTVTELFSFDHDLGAFVSIGTATVADDGLTVRSDPGFGVLQAGWHCGAPVGAFGIFASISVAIIAPPKPIILCPAGPPILITAAGAPPVDGIYDWETGDPSIALLFRSGPDQCPDSPICSTTAFAEAPGTTKVQVTFTCKITGASVTDKVDVWVPKVEIKDVQICGDRITTTLGPDGFPGSYPFTLRLKKADGTVGATLVYQQLRGAGTYTDHFGFSQLPAFVEFATLEAVWKINDCEVTVSKPAHFESLGNIRHTQYNCPSESDPSCGGGSPTPVCFSDASCNYSGPEMLPSTFVNQVLGLLQGTGCGITPNHGNVQQEAFCQRHGHPFPAACGGHVLRQNSPGIVPSCGGGLSDGTVAINLAVFAPYLHCGDNICILIQSGGIQKTVTDNCPACDLGSMDDFSTSGACGIHDFGTAVTLKIF
jgi:hypothetical protein